MAEEEGRTPEYLGDYFLPREQNIKTSCGENE